MMTSGSVPRRAAVLLGLLASASNQTLLAALTVGSLNTALLSSASAATCVTGVTSTFANVINDVSGQPGATVVTAVTPTMATALTNVTANQGTFLTSAALAPVTGIAVTGVTTTTGTVTGITPGSSNPSLRTIAIDAFDPEQRPSGGPVCFQFQRQHHLLTIVD